MGTKHRAENGQAIVLIVLAIIALLGFTALAVDGSMVYSDRRWAQNVSDSSALAGAGTAAQDMEHEGYIYRVGDAWGGASGCPAPVGAVMPRWKGAVYSFRPAPHPDSAPTPAHQCG